MTPYNSKKPNLSSYKKQTTIQEHKIKPGKNFIFQLQSNFSDNIEVETIIIKLHLSNGTCWHQNKAFLCLESMSTDDSLSNTRTENKKNIYLDQNSIFGDYKVCERLMRESRRIKKNWIKTLIGNEFFLCFTLWSPMF